MHRRRPGLVDPPGGARDGSPPDPAPADRPRTPEPTGSRVRMGWTRTLAAAVTTAARGSPRTAAWVTAVVASLLVVLGVAPLSSLVGHRPDRPAGLSVEVSTGAGAPTGYSSRQDVPLGLPADAEIRTVEDVRPYAVQALGPAGADALLAVLGSEEMLANQLAVDAEDSPQYRYRFPSVESFLGGTPAPESATAWTALGAALTVLAAQAPLDLGGGQATAEDNAGPAAFA